MPWQCLVDRTLDRAGRPRIPPSEWRSLESVLVAGGGDDFPQSLLARNQGLAVLAAGEPRFLVLLDLSRDLMRGVYEPMGSTRVPDGDDVFARACRYLVGLAQARRGQVEKARATWGPLGAGEPDTFTRLVQVQAAQQLSLRGHNKAALERLEATGNAAPDTFPDLHSRSAHLGLLATCHLALGEFAACEARVKDDVDVSLRAGSAFWLAASRRLEINLLADREEYEKALSQVDEWLVSGRLTPVTEVILKKLRVRCHAALGDVAALSSSFADVEATLVRHGFDEDAISLVEERCALAFATPGGAAPMDLVRKELARVVSLGDAAAECVARLGLARVLALGEDHEEALLQAESSLGLARRQGYRVLECRVLRAIAGLEAKRGRTEEARAALRSALAVASEVGLPRSRKETLDALAFADDGAAALDALFLRRDRGLDDAWRTYGRYLPIARTRVLWRQGESITRLTVDEAVAKVAGAGRTIVLRDGARLVRHGRPRAVDLSFAGSTLVERVCARLLARPDKALSCEELLEMQTGRKAEYHPLQHGASQRVLMSRARERLAPSGLGVEFDGRGYAWRLTGADGLVSLRFETPRDEGPRTERASDALHAWLRRNGPTEVSTLLGVFGVTRQALHRHTTDLVARGLASKERKGRTFVIAAK